MAFAVTNLCNSNAQKCSGDDWALAALDCFLVALMVTAICLIVIGKVDLGQGVVGTMNTSSVQAMLGISGGIVALDMVALYLKNRANSKGEEERPFPVAADAQRVAGVAALPPAEEEWQDYIKLDVDTTQLLTYGLFHPTKGRKLDAYQDLNEFTSPLEVFVSESEEDGVTRLFIERNQDDLMVTGKIVWSMLLELKVDAKGALHVKYPERIRKWQWPVQEQEGQALCEITIPEDDQLVEHSKILTKFREFEAS